MGRPFTTEHKEKIRQALMGHKVSDETRARMSEADKKRRLRVGPESANWKGDAVGYRAVHTWIRNTYGDPRVCSKCGTDSAKQYDWHNIPETYRRDVADWEYICRSCHRKTHVEGEVAIRDSQD